VIQLRLVCPYCYERLRPWQLGYRCTGRRSRSGTVCPSETDTVLLERMGRAEALPPSFTVSPLRALLREAACPVCGDGTRHRVCPRCHSELPLHFARIPSRLIAVIGARDSGKTVYITVLLRELKQRVGPCFNASVVGSDELTRQRFGAEYERPLYDEGVLAAVTRSAGTMAAGVVPPLVFRLSVDRRHMGRARESRSLLSFFDTAGEDLTSQRSVDTHVRYLANADGVIVVLDPLQMAGARRLATPGSRLPARGAGVDGALNALVRVTELLHKGGRAGAAARIRKPTAVVFTKLDALWPQLGPGSPLRQPSNHAGEFDIEDSLRVDEEVRALLNEWDGAEIDQFIRHNYARHRYFGLSALGETPTAENRVSPRGIRPHRVADAILWLLSEFGVVSSAGR
jgi:double-GTPase-like protein